MMGIDRLSSLAWFTLETLASIQQIIVCKCRYWSNFESVNVLCYPGFTSPGKNIFNYVHDAAMVRARFNVSV